MILKRNGDSLLAPLHPLFRRRWLMGFAILCGFSLVVGGTALWGIYYGMYLYKLKAAASLADFFDDVVASRLQIIPNFVAGKLAPAPPRLTLDIKHTDFQKLAYAREIALQRGLLLTSPDDLVPATLRYRDGTAKVKVRLKGDWADHLLGEKWSFRVKVKGANSVMGMKVFSLHHPRTRRFIYEWIFHQALQREGLLNLRYEFVDLTVNGKSLGIYALEEHFDKRLIERNERREGPILSFNEDLHWRDIHATGARGHSSPTGLRGARASYVDAFRMKSLRGNPAQWDQFLAAASLLEAFRAGELPVSQVFETKQLAMYFALLDLLGAEHSASWINLRFYYNGITARLEPIGFDGNAGSPLDHPLGSSQSLSADDSDLTAMLFADPAFFAEYVAALERVSDPAYVDALVADIRGGLDRNLRILYKEFPYVRFDEGIFYRNQETIRNTLSPVKGLHAYYDGADPDSIRLEIANLGALPVEVLGLTYDGVPRIEPTSPRILRPTAFSASVAYQPLVFAIPGQLVWSDEMAGDLRVEYRLLGARALHREQVFPWPRRIHGLTASNPMRRPPNAREFAFIEFDEASRSIHVRPGSWRVDRDLLLPAGYRVHAGPGTRIDLVNSAAIVSSSALELRGSPDLPIAIESSDGTGQGLLVVGAAEKSILEYVTFRNLGSPARIGWALTGAVTFYESPVAISHAEFSGNSSEDALNIVRSDFTIDGSLFADTASDAFDADFSDGAIHESAFTDMGNDAIDVSGSRVSVSRVRIQRAGDKALSAGEHAALTVRDVEVTGAAIGVASKDRSTVFVDGLKLRDSGVGLAVFVKKPEFGPASMEVIGVTFEGVETEYLVETGSHLTVDGRSIAPNCTDVKAQLYGSG